MARVPDLRHLPRQVWIYARLKRVTWLEAEGVAACRYPANARALEELSRQGVRVLINLHQRPHRTDLLERFGLTHIHLPVPDFTPPSQVQLEQGVAEIAHARSLGVRVAVHCGAGLGRTGTLLACYLVSLGSGPDEAIARMRALRPGSVETPEQAAAVVDYARRRASSG